MAASCMPSCLRLRTRRTDLVDVLVAGALIGSIGPYYDVESPPSTTTPAHFWLHARSRNSTHES